MKVHGGSPQGRTPDPAGRCLPCRLQDGCVISGDRGGLNGCGTPGGGVGVGRTCGGGEGRHAVPRPAVLGEESGDPSAPGPVSETSPGPLRACGVPDSDDGTPGHWTGDGVSPPDQRQVNCACAAGPGLPGDRDGEASPPGREEVKLANGGFHVISASRDDRGGGQDPAKDSPFPGPGPPLRTPSPPSSPGAGWAVRPQSLGTWGGAAGSLSCDATPLSPGDGGEAYLGAGRRQSAPDPLLDPLSDLLQDPPLDPLQDPPEPSDLAAPKRFAIAEFFSRSLFSRKTKEPMVPTQNATGWRLFGKAAPESDAGQQRPLPPGRRKQLEFEPQSTTALILEDRPGNLPAKCEQEAHRHKQEYQEMVAGARRREVKEAQRRKRQMKERHRQEESISHAINTWNTHILPHWDEMKCSRRVRELWWQGLPPSVRGRVWSLAIGNDLNITPELYDIFLCRVKDRWRCSSETSSVNDSESDGGASLADRESSLDLIKLDISRTFPSLFIFQKGGPYHDVLHRLLGAYTCYRPDIGYMLKYFAAFEVFFEENLPRLFRHFLDNNLTPDLYLIDWLFTLYSRALPLDVACRVWDVFCRDGEESLFRTALGVLRLYQDVLLQMDFIHMAQFLTRLPPDLPPHLLFSSMANTHMVSRAGRWAQVFSSLMKDGNKETDKNGSPALRS